MNEGRDYLLFSVGNRDWAVPASLVDRIFTLDNLTPVPLTSPGIAGICNTHGVAVPVVDLSFFRGEPTIIWRIREKYGVLVRFDEMAIALLADRIGDISYVPDDRMREDPRDIATHSFPRNRETVVELDLHKLVQVIRVSNRKEAARAGSALHADGPGPN